MRGIFDLKNRQKTLDFTGKNRKNFLKNTSKNPSKCLNYFFQYNFYSLREVIYVIKCPTTDSQLITFNILKQKHKRRNYYGKRKHQVRKNQRK